MNNKKLMALQLILEGKLSKKEIADKIDVTTATIRRWEQEPEFQEHRKRCTEKIRESILNNLTLLAERLIEAIYHSADEIPPKESLDMLLKLLEKGDQIGLKLTEKVQTDEISMLSDDELKGIIRQYINENGEK